MSWKTLRLGDILTRKKDLVPIENDKDYKLVTIRLYHNGVVLREEKKGADIGQSKMSQISSGDFVLSGIDARNGAFGIVPKELDGAVISNDFWCLDIDEERLDKNFFYFLTTTPFFDHICKQASDGTTQRIRLQAQKFFNYTIELPPKNEQIKIYQRLEKLKEKNDSLLSELTRQRSLLARLRQSILQDAVQGQLTAAWRQANPNVEPASELLRRIRTEKAATAKKEKPLPPVTEKDLPFVLPEGWVWCRLGEVALNSEAGKSLKCEDRRIENGEWGIIKVSAVSWDEFKEEENKFLSTEAPSDISVKVETGDFIISRANTSDLVGKSVVVKEISKNVLLSDKTIRFHFHDDVSPLYLNIVNNGVDARKYYAIKGTGSSPSMKNITRDHMNNLLIPLPPLPEQAAIVARVESLLARVSDMEAESARQRVWAEGLLQAALREAMGG